MFDRLIYFSIHNKLIIGLLTLALVAWGGYSLSRLPLDAVPDITTNQVVVYTVAPSLAASDIERLVTFPVEQSVATIPGREQVRSFSRFGLSVVTIVFPDDVDVYWARQQVSERLREAESQIPAGVGRPELAPVTTGLGEIYQYIVRAKPGYERRYDARELRTIQDWLVRRQLLGTPGVADVSSFGGELKQFEVALDPARLRAAGVTIDQVYQAVARNNQNTGGAYLDQKPTATFIRTEGLARNAADLGNSVVRATAAGLPVLVRDVADVRLGSAIRYGAMTRNAEGEVTGGLVLMLKGANANEVIRAVQQRMTIIRRTLPAGVAIDVFLDRSELVGRAIHTVRQNLLEGALIVVGVLVLFLGNWRAGLVVASVIPLALLFAIGLMRVFGVTGNLLSLGAIDFGLVVDGAVIIVEAIVHRLHTPAPLGATAGAVSSPTGELTQPQLDAATYEAASTIRSSAAFGELIILIVYLPLLALAGIEGKMFRPMAQTVAFAIAGAFILSLTYVPMMAALGLRGRPHRQPTLSDKLLRQLTAGYRPVLGWALRHRAGVLAAAGGLLVGALLLLRTLGGEFIPQLSEGDFAVEMRVLTGSSLSYTVDKAQQAAAILQRQFPEVKEVVAKIGAAEIPTDPMPIEAADLIIVLEKDPAKWTSARSREELAEQMAAAVGVLPGVTFSFQQPIQMRFNELISGAKQDVVLKIYGEDLRQLGRYAAQAARLARQVPGAEDVYVEQVAGLPQVVVQLDRDRLARFGLNVDEVNRTVQTAFAGQVAGQLFEQERRFDVVLRLAPALRRDIGQVRQLLVATPGGAAVPLEQLATIELVDGPNQVQRDDAQRRITVAFNVRGRDVESVVQELQNRVSRQLRLAPGYHVTYGGQFENLRQATGRLRVAVPVALALIFVLLYFTFRSLRQAALVFTAIPLAAIGGVLALALRGMPFSIPAGVGFIALFGVAVLNGIVLISSFNQLKQAGVASLYHRILTGTQQRLRPVLMTATVASLGFLPMALSTSAGAEVQRPLATVVIGGLVTATLLTLLVLPVLYALAEGRRPPRGTPPPATPAGTPALTARASQPQLAALLAFVAFGLGLLPAAPARAQGTLTAQQAVAQALQANGTVQAAQGALQAQQALRRTAFDVGRTTLVGTYGQFNSPARDNGFTLAQSLALPATYRAQAGLNQAQVAGRVQQLAQVQAELRRQVRRAYEQAVYARQRLRTLRGQDSIYAEFLRAAQLRFQVGEAARLEPANAVLAQGETQNLLAQTRADLLVAQRQLQALLQAPTPVPVADSTLRLLPAPALSDTARLAQTPQALALRQQLAERRAATHVEQAQGLPTVTLGYTNQSLRGTYQEAGGPPVTYGPADRFQAVQAGLALPLLRGPQRARVQAARLQEQVAASGYQRYRAEAAAQLDELHAQLAAQRQRVQFYEQAGLPQAAVIVRLSQRAYKAGETTYTELLVGLERALGVRTAYLEAVLAYNQTVIDLDYLLGNQ